MNILLGSVKASHIPFIKFEPWKYSWLFSCKNF